MRVWGGIELNSREAATRCPARLCVPLACGLAYCQATSVLAHRPAANAYFTYSEAA